MVCARQTVRPTTCNYVRRVGHGVCNAAGVTQPRLNRPATVMITRRSSQRTFLFRLSKAVREMYLYLLAVTAGQYGIEVHAVVLMSMHEHLVVSDPHGRR